MGTVTFRVRSFVWFVTGAVLAAAVTVMFMNAWRVDAAPGDDDATFVPITPCRLADTRPAPIRVGTAGALGVQATQTFAVHGTNGECTIPAEAVAVSMNVTAVGASLASFLTFWPDGDQPLAASLNPAPGQPPTPNAVTVDLSGAGGFNVYNDKGTVNVVIDINGYYIASSLEELASRLTAVEASTATNTSDITANSAGIEDLDAAQPFTKSASRGGSFLTDEVTGYLNVTVTAPVGGQVALAASTVVAHTQDGGDVRCIIAESTNIPSDLSLTPAGTAWFERPSANGSPASLSPVAAFDVAAGETVEYVLACEEEVDGGEIFTMLLTAIFTPAP